MSNTQTLLIKGLISELPPEDAALCHKIADEIRTLCKTDNEGIGILALSLVGAEYQGEDE